MHLIVGVDPGTTTGVAVLNLRGEVVDLFSSRDLSRNRVIERLISLGKVSIIASDVTPAPYFVSKLAAQLGAIVYTPAESIPVYEKTELTRQYKPGDSHQRDSLAAALLTLNNFKNKIQKIDSMDLGDDVKHLVLQGHSIKEAVKKLQGEEKPERVEKPKPQTEKTLSREEKLIKKLEKQNQQLRKQLDEEKQSIAELKKKVSAVRREYYLRLRKESEIEKRDLLIESLESSLHHTRERLSDLDELRLLWKKLSKNEVKPVGVFPEVFDGFTLILRKLKKKELDNLSKVKVAFTPERANHSLLADKGVFVTGIEYLREVSGCYYINTEDQDKLKREAVSLERIIEDYRGKRLT